MNEKEIKTGIKNPDLFENQKYNESISLKNQEIADREDTIEILQNQIADRDKQITLQGKEIKILSTAKKEAESQVAIQKELKVEHKGNYYKTDEEKFEDGYKQACERLRGN